MPQTRIALITAGGSGMGAAAARKLAADGYRVGVLSSSGKGEALAKELDGVGVTGSNQSLDDLKRLVDLAMAKWGRIDALVNSAGHGPRGPVPGRIGEFHQDLRGHVCGEEHPHEQRAAGMDRQPARNGRAT